MKEGQGDQRDPVTVHPKTSEVSDAVLAVLWSGPTLGSRIVPGWRPPGVQEDLFIIAGDMGVPVIMGEHHPFGISGGPGV